MEDYTGLDVEGNCDQKNFILLLVKYKHSGSSYYFKACDNVAGLSNVLIYLCLLPWFFALVDLFIFWV